MKEQHSTTLMMLLSAVGLFDSLYLVNEHYNASGLCRETGSFLGIKIDCGTVLTSKYSEILGLPVALLGFFYYLTVFLLIYLKPQVVKLLETKYPNITVNQLIMLIVSLGLLFTLYFVWIQLIVLERICKYCMLSAATTITLFSFAIYLKYYQ
jgi:uncharacterized membrane protein